MPSQLRINRSSVLTALATAIVMTVMLTVSIQRIKIDTDIINSLPEQDPILADARYVLAHHGFQNQIVVDLFLPADDPDRLIAAADDIEGRMQRSGLFEQVGIKDYQHLFSDLLAIITRNLPMLLSADDLNQQAADLLTPEAIQAALQRTITELSSFDGIGQADLLVDDPLGFRKIVLARLALASPVQNARLYRGHLVSTDRRHLLIIAKPITSGTDTTFAKTLDGFFRDLAVELDQQLAPGGQPIKMTPMGAYRAALDNERIAKRDMQRVIALSTVGIAMLLLFCFPRPYVGLLSFLPAVAGTVSALFIFSIYHPAISVLTLAFGGAIISITVDHGITYLLFMDRPYSTTGRDAAKEVWSIGLLAALTTIGAFCILSISGYAVLNQIGQFAAMGIAMSFLFVHTVFPYLITGMPPATKDRSIGLQQWLARIADWGGSGKAVVFTGLAVVMAFFAKPTFNNDFRTMNTVSPQTQAAERWISQHWQSFSSRVFLTSSAGSVEALQDHIDQLMPFFQSEFQAGRIQNVFVPSMLFPGPERSRLNFNAWRSFWHPERVAQVAAILKKEAQASGFTESAFDPFIARIDRPVYHPTPIPQGFYSLLGIARKPTESSSEASWFFSSIISPGPVYNAESFVQSISKTGLVKVFEPTVFSQRLGQNLANTFQKMVMVIGLSVVGLVFLFFMDWQLALAALMPVGFAFIMTLGTLNLLGHPVDIPGLMLSIVVLGMGIDYTLFLVCARQRYRSALHPSTSLVRLAVFLASTSTLIGFGSLNFAGHNLLQSAGLTCFLGIAYSLVGAYTILPPMLNALFPSTSAVSQSAQLRSKGRSVMKRVYARYRHTTALTRMAVIRKLASDPIFDRLPPTGVRPRSIVLFGVGRGETAAWLMEACPQASMVCVEPDVEHRRVAGCALGSGVDVFGRFTALMDAAPSLVDLVVLDNANGRLTHGKMSSVLHPLSHRLTTNGAVLLRDKAPKAPAGRFGLFGPRRQQPVEKPNDIDAVKDLHTLFKSAGLRIDAIQRCGGSRLVTARKRMGIET